MYWVVISELKFDYKNLTKCVTYWRKNIEKQYYKIRINELAEHESLNCRHFFMQIKIMAVQTVKTSSENN